MSQSPYFHPAAGPLEMSTYQFDDPSDAASIRPANAASPGPPISDTPLPEHLWEVMRQREARTLGRVHLPDGRVLLARAWPLDGTGVGVLWEDVTGEQQASERQRRLDEQLLQSRKMEAITRLAGGVSHDFNNLMTAIMGYSDLIMSEIDGEDPLRSDIQEILQAAQRATHLTRQLSALNPQRITQGCRFDVNQKLREWVGRLDSLAGSRVKVDVDTATEACTVLMDPDDLEQVLVNLVLNAKEAMMDGGSVSIAVRRRHFDDMERLVTLGLAAQEYVEIVIRDTGAGMSAEVLSRIFEPFYTTRSKARGLGLTVVYGIVKTADGAIEVESLESAGSVFTIHLPACPDVPPAANPAPHGGDKVILLAEDEEMLGELMQRILRRRGFRVLAARNGAEALKIAEEFDGTIDLLITDVVMPEVTGTELAERLRHTRPATRVLFISGYTDARIIQESVRVDRADFMHKPFTPQVFDDKVRELLVRPT